MDFKSQHLDWIWTYFRLESQIVLQGIQGPLYWKPLCNYDTQTSFDKVMASVSLKWDKLMCVPVLKHHFFITKQ